MGIPEETNAESLEKRIENAKRALLRRKALSAILAPDAG